MHDKEAIEMMQRCKQEIQALRLEIARLRPKADAYEAIVQILSLLPRPAQGMGEDVVWIIERRIRELQTSHDGAANGEA